MVIDGERIRINNVISTIQADANVDLSRNSISIELDLESIAKNALRTMGIAPCTVNIYAGNLKIVMEAEYEDVSVREFKGMKISQKKE